MSPSLDDPAVVAAWLAGRFEEDGIEYAIGGALALGAHGIPRMTDDADFAVYVEPDALDRFFDSLERAGCLFDRRRAQAEAERISLVRVRCGRVGVDFFISFHPHHHEALKRRVRLPGVDARDHWFLSAEDLAVHKLLLLRPKDVADLERLFAARGADLDAAYVRRWIHAITPEPDPRRSALEDLVRRFCVP